MGSARRTPNVVMRMIVRVAIFKKTINYVPQFSHIGQILKNATNIFREQSSYYFLGKETRGGAFPNFCVYV